MPQFSAPHARRAASDDVGQVDKRAAFEQFFLRSRSSSPVKRGSPGRGGWGSASPASSPSSPRHSVPLPHSRRGARGTELVDTMELRKVRSCHANHTHHHCATHDDAACRWFKRFLSHKATMEFTAWSCPQHPPPPLGALLHLHSKPQNKGLQSALSECTLAQTPQVLRISRANQCARQNP